MALPVPTPTAEELRKAIIARLGIDPTKLTGFGGDPEFDAKVTDLYRRSTKSLGDLDTRQARLGSDYETDLSNLNIERGRGMTSLMNTLADRGLADSGLAVSQRADLERNYANQLQGLNLGKTRTLEDVGTQRNEIVNSLLSGRGTYEGEYANNLSQFLQQQAQAAAMANVNAPVPVATPAAVKRKVSQPASTVVKPVAAVKPVATKYGAGYKSKGGNTYL